MNDMQSGERLNDPTITQEQEGQNWQLCDGDDECSDYLEDTAS